MKPELADYLNKCRARAKNKKTGPMAKVRSIPTDATNKRLDRVKVDIRKLIAWAEADAEHALENNAPVVARDDKFRAKIMRLALTLLDGCRRA